MWWCWPNSARRRREALGLIGAGSVMRERDPMVDPHPQGTASGARPLPSPERRLQCPATSRARVRPACRRAPALLMAAYGVGRRQAVAAGQLTGLELGRHLHRRGGEPGGSRSRRRRPRPAQPIALPFPEALVPALEEYLARWRPQLALALPCGLKQVSGICASHAHLRITRHTRAAFVRSTAWFPRCPGDHGGGPDSVTYRLDLSEVLGSAYARNAFGP